ncbi:MAG: hypothetical protein NTY45_07515 [Elusimicrobia bacterium]|nr:hypothetical protein [Elusimicrobiota bacterium]
MRAKCFLAFSLLALTGAAQAGEGLMYLEAQGVAGYSSVRRAAVYHSMSAGEPMQKTSAGFDLLRKFSTASGDAGTLAVQGRLAYDPDAPNRLEPQLYNAYYRARTPYGYFWLGHNRTAAGLEAYYDTHGALLQTLPRYGYGFDRDWGLGGVRDLNWGDAAFSLTTGSGMRLRGAGGYLGAGRVSRGVLNRDNYTAGVYFSAGEIPAMSGYTVMDGAAKPYSAVGSDLALLWNSWEFRCDVRGGTMRGTRYFAGLGRAGYNFLGENRLKVEAQAVYSGLERAESWTSGLGVSFVVTPALTVRALYEYEDAMNEKRLVTQLYYYLPL